MRLTFGRFTPFAIAALAAVFVACDESPTALDSQDQALTAPALAAGGANPVVRSARGSAHLQTQDSPNFREPGWRVFTFNAIQRQDGTVTGNMKYDVHDQGDPAVTHRVKGKVFCMADLGNDMIAIGAEGTQRTPYDQPPVFAPFGTPLLPPAVLPDDWGIFFVVRDNGEGASASGPDQITGVVQTDLANVYGVCLLGENHPLAPLAAGFLNDVEAGDIQVSW
jgi:hypothetical protein